MNNSPFDRAHLWNRSASPGPADCKVWPAVMGYNFDLSSNGKTDLASFIRTNLIEFFKSITQLPDDETIRPVLTDPEAPLRLNPDEINRFITPFEVSGSLAA